MKKIIYIILALTSYLVCKAQHPFQLELKTAKESYIEGERIEFTLTMKNLSSVKGFSVLLPGNQNEGKKLLQLNWLAGSHYNYLHIQEEERDIKMRYQKPASPEVVFLKPGQEITIPFYWNDFADTNSYKTKTASHHSFGRPLFEGDYSFMVHYNPKGSCKDDAVFRYTGSYFIHGWEIYETYIDSSGRLELTEYGTGSTTCKVTIKKNPLGKFSIEGKQYRAVEKGKRRYYFKENPQNVKYIGYSQKSDNKVTLMYYKNKDDNFYLELYPDTKIKEFKRYKDRCNLISEGCKFDEKGRLVCRTETNQDKVTATIYYFPDGRIDYQLIYWNEQATKIKYVYNARKKNIKELRTEFEYCR